MRDLFIVGHVAAVDLWKKTVKFNMHPISKIFHKASHFPLTLYLLWLGNTSLVEVGNLHVIGCVFLRLTFSTKQDLLYLGQIIIDQ